MTEPACAPAAARNAKPILDVLKHEFADTSAVFEIGSGTGQHAVFFATAMPHLAWQPSDLERHHAQIRAHHAAAGCANVLEPLSFDVRSAAKPVQKFDAVFTCNTMHIMSFDAVRSMLSIVGMCLPEGGRFCCYGPFRVRGEFTTDSNAAFDKSLRCRDPDMGIRDLEAVDELARKQSLDLQRIYAMPANNFLVVWTRQGTK